VHNNYYFLRQLSAVLDRRLKGFMAAACFSQQKDELILEFNDAETSFFIRATLTPALCCLSFPDAFARAGKNSIDLFSEIILKKITGVRQYENERSFSIAFEDDLLLLFKMHGTRSNIILVRNDRPEELFRHHLAGDLAIDPRALDRSMTWSQGDFEGHLDALPTHYFTFGQEVWHYLKAIGFDTANTKAQWTMMEQVRQRLSEPEYFIRDDGERLVFSLLRWGNIVRTFTDPLKAINEFYHAAIHTAAVFAEKKTALQQLRAQLASGTRYLEKSRLKLTEILSGSEYKVWADLLMANLHRIKRGDETTTVENFYDENKPLRIKLNKDLNAQKNAEIYYRKARHQPTEIAKLKESIARKENELEIVRKNIAAITGETNIKNLRRHVEQAGLRVDAKGKQPVSLPYHEHLFKGFVIWVGKNAVSNDFLTLKHTFKEDLWLHAKDVSGSHVIIKYQSGKKFPKDVIEYAAGLAAFHSKRKNESLCPVTVTPKKFVRKRKGDPPGMVVVEREDVILATPRATE